ncbi:MAG: hypothetical protein WBF42_12775, partial [Terracidiphilus sp.]
MIELLRGFVEDGALCHRPVFPKSKVLAFPPMRPLRRTPWMGHRNSRARKEKRVGHTAGREMGGHAIASLSRVRTVMSS